MPSSWKRYSLRAVLILVAVVAVLSALAASRLQKIRTERRIAAMCVDLGASVTRTNDGSGWVQGLHFSSASALNDRHLRELSKLQHLQSLSLNQTDVTGEGLEALTNFPSLRRLDVKESQLTDEGIEALKELGDDVRIRVYGVPENDPRVLEVLGKG